ncbi:MAG TPA: NAD(P)-dependent alcohol dehydrogenase [Anaeromyxobacteraceae bacterium]|nr:NAD(P)-dependent alcohol dehydrogenase [Anaeromyxobacteraceae bacterium]
MAAVLRRAGKPLSLERLEIDGPRDDEVLVHIAASGICRTDIDWCEAGGPLPAVVGHEGAGMVVEVGRRVKDVERGAHVVLSYQSCGGCSACVEGHPAACARFFELNFGFQRLDGTSAYSASGVRGHFFGQSSFATFALATERNIVKVDRALPLEVLSPLGCGLQTGAGTVIHSLGATAGHSVAIFGVGTVGLAAVMAARIVEADPIIAVDIRPQRLAIACELGATHAVCARHTDVERIARITGHGVDRVVESTGDRALARAGLELLSPGGRMALLTGGATRDLPRGRKVMSVIQGDAVPQTFIPRLIQLWQRGDFPFDRLLRYYDFSDVNRAIADANRGRAIKPVLRMTLRRQVERARVPRTHRG